MRVAVTGSEGFLGKLLVKELRERSDLVIECTHRNCDILDAEAVKKTLKGAEIVIHLAAQLDEQAKDLYEVNVRGTDNVLEACATNNISQFVFASTAGVYGSAKGMKTEETSPWPETPYERSKLEAEKKALSFQEVFGVTILRPALILGNNKYWHQIISTVAKGFPLIGEGKNKWQVACAQDVVESIIFCMGREECYGEIFIVAEKDALTLEQIANAIRKELRMKGEIPKIPLWLGMIIATINSILNFNPILKPAYVKRMQFERSYSTKKLEALGWSANCSAKDKIPALIKEFLAQKQKST